jgi:hypothetical protein
VCSTNGWVTTYGPPECVISDAGTEFRGKFSEYLDQQLITTTAVMRMPHGRTAALERAGGSVKYQVQRIQEQFGGIQLTGGAAPCRRRGNQRAQPGLQP